MEPRNLQILFEKFLFATIITGVATGIGVVLEYVITKYLAQEAEKEFTRKCFAFNIKSYSA